MGYEFRSRQHLFGLPLLHITWGTDPFTGRARVARGVIAVGQVALGVLAIGPVAVGVVAVGLVVCGAALAAGQIATALWSFGQVAVGAIAAFGELALARGADGGLDFSVPWAWLVADAVWLGTAAALALVWRRHVRATLRLCDVPLPVAVAPPGAAVVKGRIVPQKTVEAPVSRRAVVAYDVRRVRDRLPTTPRVKVERVCEDFYVEDGSGRARVLATDIVLVLEPVKRVREAIESRVVAHNVGAGGGLGVGGGIVRAIGTAFERVLLPGDEVVVAGQAIRTLGGGPAQVQLAVHGGAGGPVLVTNRDVTELRAETGVLLWLAVVLGATALLAPLI